MKALRVVATVGARPNFMKIAPFCRALKAYGDSIETTLVHTGQHYDANMSASFFQALDIPRPDIELGIGSGSHAEQVGQTMIAFERVLRERRPHWVVVVGDVNATCACSITAKKERVKLAHIEAGLRSGDLGMPEEINRLVTDRLSDLLFTPDAMADANLAREGAPAGALHRVGNIMIDTLEAQRAAAAELDPAAVVGQHLDASASRDLPALTDGGYALLTLHRPSNVDDAQALARLVKLFAVELSAELPLVWTLHPRARKRLAAFGLLDRVLESPGILPLEPLGYRETLRLNMGAAVALTDSGGIQEECCVLGTPCITLRTTTERPITLETHGGVSVLAGNDCRRIRDAFARMRRCGRRPRRPPLWDGATAQRIAAVFAAQAEALG